MKFNAGDWVTIKGTLPGDKFKLTEKEIENKEVLLAHFSFSEKTWERWQPKSDEYILAIDNNKIYLVKFLGMNYNKFVCAHLDGCSEAFTQIEPFIGKLPSYIKDEE